MKRYIHASEDNVMPDGYLKTSKFTAPSIKTDDQRNALEALEIAISQKFKSFETMLAIQTHLTSGASWQGIIQEYPIGYYVKLEATRSNFAAFVQGDQVVRKPVRCGDVVREYEVSGEGGAVYWMSRGKEHK